MTPPLFPKPPLTEYELSQHTALAGIQAAAMAEQSGGDPQQVGALFRAAQMQPSASVPTPTRIGGVDLHDMSLAVTIAYNCLIGHPGTSAASNADMTMRMIQVFHDPIGSWELLRRGDEGSLYTLDVRAMQLSGHFTQRDIAAFSAYVASFMPHTQPEAQLGKQAAPPSGTAAMT